MSGFAGTGALARLALRLDRVRLTAWVLAIAVSPAATAAQYTKLYPDSEAIGQVSAVVSNPSLVAMNGPLFASTLGGLTSWKIVATELILASLMSMLTVIRHTRAEEESGRLELLQAGVVGRYAPLTSALLVAALANLASAILIALGLIGTGLPAAGSVAMGLAVGLVGLTFAGVAAVAAQLTASARPAIGIAAGALGVSYLLRAIGDTGPTWLTWLSPLGWAIRTRPYATERWWLLGLLLAFAAALAVAAYVLLGHRDAGGGLLPQRPGPAQASARLGSPLTLAWRLHRGLLLGWLIAMAVWGAALGGAASGVGAAIGVNQQITDLLARMGGLHGLVDAYLSVVFGLTGLIAAVYTVQATLRMRAEESAGRLEPLLATPAGRVRWALSHLAFAVLGTAVLLAAAGAGAGLAYGLQIHDVGGELPRLFGAALVQLPAAWIMAGLGAALFGFAPRLAGLTWVALIACLVLLEVGALLGLDQRLLDVSPFAHVPRLPGSPFTATPLLWLTATAALLTGAGLVGFRRRDIG